MQLTGSTLWVDNAKELLRGDCLDEIQMNETTPDPPGQDSLCPGLSTICSGNGRCIQGVLLNGLLWLLPMGSML